MRTSFLPDVSVTRLVVLLLDKLLKGLKLVVFVAVRSAGARAERIVNEGADELLVGGLFCVRLESIVVDVAVGTVVTAVVVVDGVEEEVIVDLEDDDFFVSLRDDPFSISSPSSSSETSSFGE